MKKIVCNMGWYDALDLRGCIILAVITMLLPISTYAQTCDTNVPNTSKGLTDSDGDGISDALDNCVALFNPNQVNTDSDEYGNRCDADLNNDQIINFTDISLFQQRFLSTDLTADFNVDGAVNFLDFAIIASDFLQSPGPAGLCVSNPSECAGPVDFLIDDEGEGLPPQQLEGNFVVRLVDPELIFHARKLIDESELCNTNLFGQIIPTPAQFNKPWSFQLGDPIVFGGDTVVPFPECRTVTAQSIEDELVDICGGESTHFRAGSCGRWCPGLSKVIAEL